MIYKKTLKPYLINAFYTWSIDLGYTPLIAVNKNILNEVPKEFTEDNIVVFNIHPNAVRNLVFGKEHIEFQARFNGISEQIIILHTTIVRVFNKENNYGLDFELEELQIKKNHLKIVKNETNDE